MSGRLTIQRFMEEKEARDRDEAIKAFVEHMLEVTARLRDQILAGRLTHRRPWYRRIFG